MLWFRGKSPAWSQSNLGEAFFNCLMPAITFSISIDITTALLFTAERQIIVIPSVFFIGQLKLSIIQEHRVLVVSGEGKHFYPYFPKMTVQSLESAIEKLEGSAIFNYCDVNSKAKIHQIPITVNSIPLPILNLF